MAEIEHFVDPLDKSHRKFHTVVDAHLPLFTAANQEGNGDIVRDLSMGDAVSRGVIGNETLGYFMVRTFLFLTDCGIRAEGIRFR
jgi:glycyl-tRNA synthetase